MTKRGAKLPLDSELVYEPLLDVKLLTGVLMLRVASWFNTPTTRCQSDPKSCLIRALAMWVRNSTPAYDCPYPRRCGSGAGGSLIACPYVNQPGKPVLSSV